MAEIADRQETDPAPVEAELGDALRTNVPYYRERVAYAFERLSLVPEESRRGRVLDIGCGTGNGVVAAAQHGANMALGIDINFAAFAHEFATDEFQQICELFGVDHQRALLIEGDVFTTRFVTPFDACVMLDSIEHVPDPRKFIELAYNCLAPGGHMLIDCGGLYHSRMGHHLWPVFPIDEFPWVHLWKDFDEVYKAHDVHPWFHQNFIELNRITHDGIIAIMRETGFEIVFEHRDAETPELRAMLDTVQDRIKPEYLEKPNLLFEGWIVAVGKRI